MLTLKDHKIGFDPWGLALFVVIMLPNFVWSAFPAPNDILRAASTTPLVDAIAQVLQIVMVAALCAVVNVTRDKPMDRGYRAGIVLCLVLYFTGWIAYYVGAATSAVILDLCLAPCGAFLLFALARKNVAALVSAGGFTICHSISSVVNFIL